MNTANTMPRPATVTKPPFCESRAGAPAVVDFTVPPVVVDEEELVLSVDEALAVPFAVDAEAFPLAVELDEVLPVAVALVVAPVFVPFPVFVEDEDWVFLSAVDHGLFLTVEVTSD
jgi:hypothetical protein